MLFGKFAPTVMLLVCTLLIITSSLNIVTEACTVKDKDEIIKQCKFHIKRGSPMRTVPPKSVCCVEVRRIRNMQCIIWRMERQERMTYDTKRVTGLEKHCGLKTAFAPPPNPNKIMV
ncbi:hypothetical protein BDA96_05G075500 [Sorghum bicolor]|uniref:Bifunctional inhibitor/plant lipid transfer protein/seed storage helical domain-containing protein n=1 Tax=Sorghum bicolor TaxID=4558 RepID=A0A921QX09_SORBI|nr:hypothetical protein BDA96_05G075500 [Sorghum bicolor]